MPDITNQKLKWHPGWDKRSKGKHQRWLVYSRLLMLKVRQCLRSILQCSLFQISCRLMKSGLCLYFYIYYQWKFFLGGGIVVCLQKNWLESQLFVIFFLSSFSHYSHFLAYCESCCTLEPLLIQFTTMVPSLCMPWVLLKA